MRPSSSISMCGGMVHRLALLGAALTAVFGVNLSGCRSVSEVTQLVTLEVPWAGDTVAAAPRTISARVQPPAAAVSVTFENQDTSLSKPMVFFAGDSSGMYRASLAASTDASGRATVWIRPGLIAGVATILASVGGGNAARATLTLLPGSPAQINLSPRDTALYVGHAYTIRGTVTDRHGNPRQDIVTYGTDSTGILTLAPGGAGTTLRIGRTDIVASAGILRDTAWLSVVPPGRIVAFRPWSGTGDTSSIVLVNLDGSDYRNFPIPVVSYAAPAWHPSGASVVYARPVEGIDRLVTLDTTTGALQRLVPSTSGILSEDAPAYSADGAWVYFSSGYFIAGRVYRVSTGTSVVEPVGYDASGMLFSNPSPSPAGDSLAVEVTSGVGDKIMVIPSSPALGSPPYEFPTIYDLPQGLLARWSPLGDQLLVEGDEGPVLITPGVAGRRALAPQLASGQSGGGFQGLAWSPDGTWVVARSPATLILIEVATGRILPLAFGSRLTEPAWRPK